MTKKITAIGCLLLAILMGSNATAADFCDDDYYIEQNLPNGSSWDMCWTQDANQGVRYHHIFYTPKSGTRRMVMYDASVAQIHVPYDDNGARYHDVSDFGLGGDFLLSLSAGDCLNGSRGYYNGRGVVCRQVIKDGSAYRNRGNRADQHLLKVFSVSRVGEYLYSSEWRFYGDGRIVPSILATGALQRYGATAQAQHGWVVGDGSGGTRIGLSHMHNFFWRLDFDLNDTSENDTVQEINFNSYNNGKQFRTLTTFTTEAARSVNPTSMRSWLIKDGGVTNSKGHNIAYEVRLFESGQREIGPSFESFTENDFYVSKSKACEKVASHNKRVYTCDTDNLQEYVNGESIQGQDIVAWVGVSFYHMPRSEDVPYMDAHVSRFEIVPRDWHTINPSLDYVPPLQLRINGIDDYAATTRNTAVLIDAIGNDSGSGIYFNTLDNPDNGTASIVNNKIQYTPDVGFIGTDVFWYSIKDSSGTVFGSRIHVTVSAASAGGGNSGGVTAGGGGAFRWFELLLLMLLTCVVLRQRSLCTNRMVPVD